MSAALKGTDTVEDSRGLQSLKDDLDDLLVRYLDAVDTYQNSINAISKHMAEGFFSLAQANRRNSSRQRYGQDYYDQRMKASRLCRVSLDDKNRVSVAIHDTATQDSIEEEGGQNEPKQQPSPPATPEPESAEVNKIEEKEQSTEAPDAESKQSSSAVKDSLRWYGVLTPKELRTAQTHFVASMSDDMSALANSARHLRALEVDIARLRKTIRKAEKALV